MSAPRESLFEPLPPLDTEGVLWVAAIDRVPIEERVEWVKTMLARVEQINESRRSRPPEAPPIEWTEVRAGDVGSLMVFGLQTGLERERRRVVGVEWPKIALAKGERIYSIDATREETQNRSLRLESRES